MNYKVVILRPLNSGGNGDLFVGQRSDNAEQVVVKFLRESNDAYARNAFAREVRVLGRSVAGLMPVLFANLAPQKPFYVMPYISGGTLTRYAGRLTEKQLHAIATSVANTLAALHATLTWHGDIKPDNILISQDGQLQVADPLGNGFGCTVFFSEHHGGTPGYWAPEICAGGPISPAGDVYSFGATLFELLTGRRPQDSQPIDSNIAANLQASVIRQLIAVCCQVNPAARPSMKEVLQMLHGVQWGTIQAERELWQGIKTVACIVVGIVLAGKVLAK